MVNLRNYNMNTVYSKEVHKLNLGNYKKLGKEEKFSIIFDPMFKTMIQNSSRLKYPCQLFSYYLDVELEKLLESFHLESNELDKCYEKDVGYRSDFVGRIGNTYLNIEVNNNSSKEIMERNMDYAFHLYSQNKERGKGKYIQIIQFNINSFAFVNNDNIEEVYMFKDDEGKILNEKLIIFQIYLPNLIKKWYTDGIESLIDKERYLLALVVPSVKNALKLGKDLNIVEEYVKDALNTSKDKKILEAYDKEWALKDEAKREGIEQGIEQNTKEIVMTMLKKGMNIELISEITKLSIDEINILQKQV